MSGGHWDYQQHKMMNFAEELIRDGDPVIRATGAHLMKIADLLNDADYVYSCDRLEWDRNALAALIGPQAVLEEVILKARRCQHELNDAMDWAVSVARGDDAQDNKS